MACLRAAVRLLDKLQLKPAETATGTGDDTMHVVSRLFNKYSTALLSSLTTCLPDSVRRLLPLRKRLIIL